MYELIGFAFNTNSFEKGPWGERGPRARAKMASILRPFWCARARRAQDPIAIGDSLTRFPPGRDAVVPSPPAGHSGRIWKSDEIISIYRML